jgi:hypothetical protein
LVGGRRPLPRRARSVALRTRRMMPRMPASAVALRRIASRTPRIASPSLRMSLAAPRMSPAALRGPGDGRRVRVHLA